MALVGLLEHGNAVLKLKLIDLLLKFEFFCPPQLLLLFSFEFIEFNPHLFFKCELPVLTGAVFLSQGIVQSCRMLHGGLYDGMNLRLGVTQIMR